MYILMMMIIVIIIKMIISIKLVELITDFPQRKGKCS